MPAIGFRFTAGRYHATPWGRHVNEGDVEWPPSPWRILRSFIFSYWRKTDRNRYAPSLLGDLLKKLSETLPSYFLPPSVHSHVRHYMPVRDGKTEKNQLIFDGFLRISSDAELQVIWKDVVLDEPETELLNVLVRGIAYFGRAESWVEARVLSDKEVLEPNCKPETDGIDTKRFSEISSVLVPLTEDAYLKHRMWFLEDIENRKMQKKKKIKLVERTLPGNWTGALAIDTGELRKYGWNKPPCAKEKIYRKKANLVSYHTPFSKGEFIKGKEHMATTIRYALFGKPLPRIEEAVRIGEVTRLALISILQSRLGRVPGCISGHGLPEGNRHGHAFFLPEAGSTGLIDHILVHVPDGIPDDALEAMKRFNRLYTGEDREWQVFFEGTGKSSDFDQISRLTGKSREWISITPYLHPWYRKKKFQVRDQVERECELRGIAPPVQIEEFSENRLFSPVRRPIHFRRFRSKRGLRQPERIGTFLKLKFQEPQEGPLSLGFGNHFGLGMFIRSD